MPEEGPVQLPTPLPPKIVGKRQRQRLIPEGGGNNDWQHGHFLWHGTTCQVPASGLVPPDEYGTVESPS